jgi:hypothetical protein
MMLPGRRSAAAADMVHRSRRASITGRTGMPRAHCQAGTAAAGRRAGRRPPAQGAPAGDRRPGRHDWASASGSGGRAQATRPDPGPAGGKTGTLSLGASP